MYRSKVNTSDSSLDSEGGHAKRPWKDDMKVIIITILCYN